MNHIPPPAHEPAGAPLVLHASTPEEFCALLRNIMERSGLNPGQISTYSRGAIPRSTAYRFVNPKTKTLPKQWQQVESFAKVCKLPGPQIATLLRLWTKLVSPKRPVSTDVEEMMKGPSRASSPDLAHDVREQIEMVTAVVDAKVAQATTVVAQPKPRFRRYWRRRESPLQPVDRSRWFKNTRYKRRLWRAAQRTTPGQLRVLAATRFSLALLVWTALLLLVIDRVAPAMVPQIVVALVVCNAVVVVRNPAVVRLSSMRTPLGCCGAFLAGVGAVVLTLRTTPNPYVSVFTGLLVFTGTLLWLDMIQWRDVLAWRGVCHAITALWFGIGIGLVLRTEGFPLAGSILAGVLVTAWGFEELQVKLHGHLWM